jgi:tripartite ATP-independent transporter DctM subunit
VEWYWAAALMVGMVLVLMALGFPVAVAFLGANAVGVYLFMGGWVGLEQLVGSASDSLSSFILVTVPLFILMGNVFYHSGVAVRVFDALDALFGRLPGRLSYVTVAGGTLFAALSGSAMANAAMMGSLMVPEMVRRGYKPRMAMGPIMGCAGLAILIPPSALAVLLGSLAQINVGALLIAGIMPGIVLALLYAILIWFQLKRDPAAAPVYEVTRRSAGEILALLVRNIAPMGIVVFCVVGLIVMGVATPTEAAAFGVLGTLIVVAMFGKLTWSVIYKSLHSSLNVTVMVFFILLGSFTFSQVFAFSGATDGLIRWATSFDIAPIVIILIMIALLLVLGCFIDGISMLLITLPVFMPLTVKLGYDPIWFGVIMLVTIEMGAISPPFGLTLYVMMGVAPPGTRFADVVSAGMPYFFCGLWLIFLMLFFPQIALWLPGLMGS